MQRVHRKTGKRGKRAENFNTNAMKRAMKEKMLFPVDIAEKLGVSRSAVENWRSGRNNPVAAHVPKLEKMLGVKLTGKATTPTEDTTPTAAPPATNGMEKIIAGIDTVRMAAATELSEVRDKETGSKLGEIIAHLNQAMEVVQ